MEERERYRTPTSYDAPPSDSELEDDNRLSSDSARFDHDWLEEEHEQERLLATGTQPERGFFGRQTKTGNRIPAQSGTPGEDSLDSTSTRRRHGRRELIHKAEEGGSRGTTPSSDSSDGSSEVDREKMGEVLARKKTSRVKRIFGYTVLHILIAALFLVISLGAYRASQSTSSRPDAKNMLSNGTSLFAPTTIYISIDGFRADYLSRNLSPTLASFIQQGVSPKYMLPSFPSLTFPNHYTLVTGLYPESHGIVANSFWDNRFSEEFMYTNKEHSMQSKWWDQHPIWATAEHQGVPTAIHMWPGSEAHVGDLEPSYVDKYNGSELLPRKVDRILDWLDRPGPLDDSASLSDPRPQLIAAYVPNVDQEGHRSGPNSTQVNSTIVQVDDMLGQLSTGLNDRNLTDIVNVVIVSDHGMATTDYTRLVQFEDIIDPDLIEHIDGWPHYGLRPKNSNDIPTIHHKLVEEAKSRDGFDVYLKEEIPARYHFQNNDRIAPIWLFVHTGWAIVTRDEYDVAEGQKSGEVYHPRGIHGYDNEDPLMRAIFVARGPAFPHKPNSRVEPFQNIEVYNIVCDSLHIEPHANNGTLRLPLKPVGLHDDEVSESSHAVTATMTSEPESSSSAAVEDHELDTDLADEKASAEGRPSAKEQAKQFWEWVKGSMREFKEWAQEHVHGHDRPPG